MTKCISILSAFFVASIASANIVYTQSFDSMGAANQAIPGTGALNAQGVIGGLDGLWQAARIGGTGTAAISATSNDGSSSSGSIFNYAQPTTDSDRALGSLASGTTTAAFGVSIINNSGLLLDTITITFDAMMFRSSTTAQNRLLFAYGFSGGTVASTDFLSSTGMTAASQGDVVGGAPVATNGIVNPATMTVVSFTLTGVSWADGTSLFVRWSDFNDAGNDAGLAIDNFSLTAVPTPGAIALLGLAGIVARRRR